PFKYLSIVRRSTFKSRANWLLLIFILELSISKFNFGKSSSPLISISVLISICICIIFTPKILCITNHLLYILIQSFLYIVRVSFINLKMLDINKTKIEVRYQETDQMGVVYHANYLVWFEIGRSKYIDQLGFNYVEMEKDNIVSPVIDLQISYKRPATYGDTVTIFTW